MSTTEYIQIIIGIGQIIAVAIIPIIVWVLGIKYQNRKAKKDAQLRVFLTLMADRKSTPITKEWVDALNTIDVVFQENKKVRHAWREYLDSLNEKSPHFLTRSKSCAESFTDEEYEQHYKELMEQQGE